jgi:hypothetical protein
MLYHKWKVLHTCGLLCACAYVQGSGRKEIWGAAAAAAAAAWAFRRTALLLLLVLMSALARLVFVSLGE